MEPEELVTIGTVNTATEAEIIRGALQDAGFACEISGENQGGFAGILAIDILVKAEQAGAAREYLAQLKHSSKEGHPKVHREGVENAIEERKANSNIQPPPESQR